MAIESAGIQQGRKAGYIQVDDQLRTNVAGIWALGDCDGKGAFTHDAYNDFEIVAANLLDNDRRKVSDRIMTADALAGNCSRLSETRNRCRDVR
jgi:pyruvate/2-oxoglutarate dehydrogenase complex dihydrolipoamide dehydrogenase (E3) component